MQKRILDTSVLIHDWKRRRKTPSARLTATAAAAWANNLIDLHGTNAIVTPVYVEFIVGFTNADELRLGDVYLEQFDIVDKGEVTKQDWEEVRRIGKRIPRSGKPRQLGDCLIRAIAKRLNYEVFALDAAFPR